MKLKPVLQIQGEKLDAFAKARTVKQAKSIMIKAVKMTMHPALRSVRMRCSFVLHTLEI